MTPVDRAIYDTWNAEDACASFRGVLAQPCVRCGRSRAAHADLPSAAKITTALVIYRRAASLAQQNGKTRLQHRMAQRYWAWTRADRARRAAELLDPGELTVTDAETGQPTTLGPGEYLTTVGGRRVTAPVQREVGA